MSECTSADLWALTNTTPSESLPQDLMETCDRIYHRSVAELQMSFLHSRNQLIAHAPVNSGSIQVILIDHMGKVRIDPLLEVFIEELRQEYACRLAELQQEYQSRLWAVMEQCMR